MGVAAAGAHPAAEGVGQTKGEKREYGKYAILGAQQGAEFGKTYKNNIKALSLINDFEWLEKAYKESVDE